MAFDTTTAADILKINYAKRISDWLNNATYFLTKIKRNREDYVGKQFYIPVHKGRNVGVGTRGESVALPAPGNQQYDKLVYTVKYLYGLVRLTGPAIESAKNNAGAFARAIDSEMKGLARDCNQMVQRQIFRDGSGLLTRCGTTSNATTVVVESTKYIYPGQIIDMRALSDGTGVSNGTGVVVLTVPSSTTFTVTTAVTTSSSHGIFLTGTRNSSAWGTSYDMWGLQGIVSTGNPGSGIGITDLLGTLTRTSNPDWQANSLTNSSVGRDLTLDLMQQAFDACDIAIGKTPGLILTNHAIMRKYANLLTPDRRYVNTMTFDGGFKGLEYNGVPVMADKDAGLSTQPQLLGGMYFLDLDAFVLMVLKDWGWLERGGSVFHLATGTLSSGAYTYVGNVDAWEAIYAAYQQLGIDNAKGLCWLGDINES